MIVNYAYIKTLPIQFFYFEQVPSNEKWKLQFFHKKILDPTTLTEDLVLEK